MLPRHAAFLMHLLTPEASKRRHQEVLEMRFDGKKTIKRQGEVKIMAKDLVSQKILRTFAPAFMHI